MKTLCKTGAWALMALLIGSAAQAATAYTCKVTRKMDHNMVPDVLFIGHDDANGEVQISDPVVYFFNDNKPLAGRMTRRTAKKVVFKWVVKGPKTNALQKVNVRYEATVQVPSGDLYVAARVTGMSGQLSGRGNCEIKTITR